MSIRDILKNFNKSGIVLVFIVLFIICALITPVFLKPSNLLNVTKQVSVIGIISIGMTFVIITGGIDLSVGPIMACGTLVLAGLKGYGPIISFIAALAVGLLIGVINGLIISKFKVQPFIVTLGGMTALVGIGLTFSNGHPIIGISPELGFLGHGKLMGFIPVQAVIFLIISIIAWFILKYTPIGRYAYAIGGNLIATELAGVNTDKITITIYGISGLLAAFSGTIMASHLNVGEAYLGQGMEMDAIAAVVIGGTSLRGGNGSVFGTVIGVLILGLLGNFLNIVNMPGYFQMIIKGVIVVGAAILQSINDRI